MASGANVKPSMRYIFDEGRPTLVVDVPNDVLAGIERKDTNAELLQQLAERLPKLFSEQGKARIYAAAREDAQSCDKTAGRPRRYAESSLQVLFAQAEGRSTQRQDAHGSCVTVVGRPIGGGLSIVAGPPKLESVDDVDQLVSDASFRMAEHYKRLGKSDDVEPKKQQMVAAGMKLKAVFTAARDGVPLSAMKSEVGVPKKTASGYFEGAVPVVLHHWLSETREKKTGGLRLPRRESVDFAFFAGACAGRTLAGNVKDRFEFDSDSLALLERVRSGILAGVDVGWMEGHANRPGGGKWGIDIKDSGEARDSAIADRYSINTPMRELRAALNASSAGNTRACLEFVGTRSEEEAFVLGFLSFQPRRLGRVKNNGGIEGEVGASNLRFTISKQDGAQLLTDVAGMFYDLGIYPSPDLSHDPPRLVFDDYQDILALRKLAKRAPPDMVSPKLMKRLDELASHRPSRRNYLPLEYEAAMAEIAARPDETGDQVRARLLERDPRVDVPAFTILRWRQKKPDGSPAEEPPQSVRRKKRLEQVLAGWHYRKEISRMFRAGGFEAEEARALATLKEDLDVAAEHERASLNPVVDSAVSIICKNWGRWAHTPRMARLYLEHVVEKHPECTQRAHHGFLARLPNTEDGRGRYRLALRGLDVDSISAAGVRSVQESPPRVLGAQNNAGNSSPLRERIPPAVQAQATAAPSNTLVQDPVKEYLVPAYQSVGDSGTQQEILAALKTLRSRGLESWAIRLSRCMGEIPLSYRAPVLIAVSRRVNSLHRNHPPTGDPKEDYDSQFNVGVNLMLSKIVQKDYDYLFGG